MVRIVVDDEQAKIVSKSVGPVEIRDRSGALLGYVSPVSTDADIVRARQSLASSEPRYTTEEVLRHLESLERK